MPSNKVAKQKLLYYLRKKLIKHFLLEEKVDSYVHAKNEANIICHAVSAMIDTAGTFLKYQHMADERKTDLDKGE